MKMVIFIFMETYLILNFFISDEKFLIFILQFLFCASLYDSDFILYLL